MTAHPIHFKVSRCIAGDIYICPLTVLETIITKCQTLNLKLSCNPQSVGSVQPDERVHICSCTLFKTLLYDGHCAMHLGNTCKFYLQKRGWVTLSPNRHSTTRTEKFILFLSSKSEGRANNFSKESHEELRLLWWAAAIRRQRDNIYSKQNSILLNIIFKVNSRPRTDYYF